MMDKKLLQEISQKIFDVFSQHDMYTPEKILLLLQICSSFYASEFDKKAIDSFLKVFEEILLSACLIAEKGNLRSTGSEK
jgi:hypothetical protein